MIVIFGTAFLAVYGYSEYQRRMKGYVDQKGAQEVWWAVISAFLLGFIGLLIYQLVSIANSN
jgi:heme/copper-type cytochrome/quinol oxidase subunit 2